MSKVFKLRKPLLGWAKGEEITFDPEWGEWQRKKTGEAYDYRSDIRTGEVAILLNFLKDAKLTSILEPQPKEKN